MRSLEIKDKQLDTDELRKKLETQYNISRNKTLEIEDLKHTITLKQKGNINICFQLKYRIVISKFLIYTLCQINCTC